MPKSVIRSQRVGDQIQKQLSRIISGTVGDEKLGLVTISAVHLNADLSRAKIFITHLNSLADEPDKKPYDELDRSRVLSVLNYNAKRFGYQLSKVLFVRNTPKLEFAFDTVLEKANRVTRLIDSLNSAH